MKEKRQYKSRHTSMIHSRAPKIEHADIRSNMLWGPAASRTAARICRAPIQRGLLSYRLGRKLESELIVIGGVYMFLDRYEDTYHCLNVTLRFEPILSALSAMIV